MAGEAAALRRLTAADPVPTSGSALVDYSGGTAAATRVLSGMAGPPARRNYAGADEYEAARRQWRSASRTAQRWAKGERGTQRPHLTPAQRRRAQTENRERKRTAARGAGIRATLTARIVIDSPGKGGRDSRRRTISNGGLGVLVEGSPEILDALAEGDTAAAVELLAEGFLDGAGLPAYTELDGASWELWPDGER